MGARLRPQRLSVHFGCRVAYELGTEGLAVSTRVPVHEVREVLRLWVAGESKRATARLARVDRKAVDRYVAAGLEVGLRREGDGGQITDELIGMVCERVRPHRARRARGDVGGGGGLSRPAEEVVGGRRPDGGQRP